MIALNISQLEYYVTAVNERSYAKTARMLYVTAQAVSKSIRDLEAEFGVSLIVRNGRGIKPTPLGLIFADQSKLILDACRNLKMSMTTKKETVESRDNFLIAVCTAECRGDLYSEHFFNSIKIGNPKIHIETSYALNDCCSELVRSGSVDMALVLGEPFESEGIAARYIATLEPKFAVSSDHSLASQTALRLSELGEVTIALPLDIRCCLTRLKHFLMVEEVKAHFESVRVSIEEHRKFLDKGGIVMVLSDKASVLPGIDRRILPQAGKLRLRFPIYLCTRMRGDQAMHNKYAYIIEKEILRKGGGLKV